MCLRPSLAAMRKEVVLPVSTRRDLQQSRRINCTSAWFYFTENMVHNDSGKASN